MEDMKPNRLRPVERRTNVRWHQHDFYDWHNKKFTWPWGKGKQFPSRSVTDRSLSVTQCQFSCNVSQLQMHVRAERGDAFVLAPAPRRQQETSSRKSRLLSPPLLLPPPTRTHTHTPTLSPIPRRPPNQRPEDWRRVLLFAANIGSTSISACAWKSAAGCWELMQPLLVLLLLLTGDIGVCRQATRQPAPGHPAT